MEKRLTKEEFLKSADIKNAIKRAFNSIKKEFDEL